MVRAWDLQLGTLPLLGLLLFAVPGGACGQGFEGTITYDLRVQGGGMQQALEAALPAQKQVTAKGMRVKTTTKGGRGTQRFTLLMDYARGKYYWIDSARKTIYKRTLRIVGPNALLPADSTYAARDQHQSVAGHRCRLYYGEPEIPGLGGRIEAKLWMAPGLALQPADTNADYEGQALSAGLKGLPLKRELWLKSLNIRILQEARRINRRSVAAEAMRLPKAFERKPFDPKQPVQFLGIPTGKGGESSGPPAEP
jgi:hypothetical protein